MTVMTEEKTSTGRIDLIPQYWGGEGANGDAAWERAMDALTKLAKSDPVLNLVREAIDDAWADCVEAALRYGRELGPDAEENVTELSDEEYEVRTGKARVQS